jgi:hypothetical protein
MNLVEFPFATLSRTPSLGSLTCVRWIGGADGQRRRQRWVVQGGSASGLPTEFDERVYVALLALTQAQGYTDRRVPLSVYRILKLMGEDTDSKHYRSVERSLERLLRASIVAEGAFWDAERQSLVQRVNGFHLIERYWLAYQEGDQTVVEAEGCPGYVVWGEEIWRSLQSGYLKQLDLRTFFGLATPVARRLYRFLDKKLHKARRLEIDIFQLSQQLGMAYYRYPAKVREKLQPGIDELIAIGFLASGEMIKVGRYTRMRFVKGAGVHREAPGIVAPEPEDSASVTEQEPADAGQLGQAWRQQVAEARGLDPGLIELWEQALGLVREQVTPVAFETWLARSVLGVLEGSQATIWAPNAFLQERIADHYAGLIARALEALLHTRIALHVRVLEEG